MNILTRPFTIAALVLATGVLCSCDGQYTMTDSFPSGIRTVHVPVWTRSKDVYRRGIEDRLTEAVIKRVQQDSPYKNTDRSRADTLLTGRLENIEQRVLSFDPDVGQAREMEMVLTVSWEWKDLRSGRVLRKESALRVSGTYIPQEPLDEDFFQGGETVINKIARRIVEQMQSDW